MIDKLEKNIREEDERKIFGYELYAFKEILPHITINPDNKDHYLTIFTNFVMVSNQFGEDIIRLFAELTLIYEIKDMDDLSDPKKETMRDLFIFIRQILSHSLTQAESIIHLIEDTKFTKSEFQDEIINIIGNDYYFIPIALSNIFSAYSMLISFRLKHSYMNNELMDAIRDRIALLISPFFDELRKNLNVVECYEYCKNSQKQKITIH